MTRSQRLPGQRHARDFAATLHALRERKLLEAHQPHQHKNPGTGQPLPIYSPCETIPGETYSATADNYLHVPDALRGSVNDQGYLPPIHLVPTNPIERNLDIDDIDPDGYLNYVSPFALVNLFGGQPMRISHPTSFSRANIADVAVGDGYVGVQHRDGRTSLPNGLSGWDSEHLPEHLIETADRLADEPVQNHYN